MIEYITAKDATFVTNALSHAVGLARKGFKVYIIGGLIKSVTGGDYRFRGELYHSQNTISQKAFSELTD